MSQMNWSSVSPEIVLLVMACVVAMVDLWVTDPNGERAYYGNRLTYQGGRMSRDFTGGYGPEEYMVRRALAGDYAVKANFFGSRAQSLTGPTMLQATVIADYGRPTRLTLAQGGALVAEYATMAAMETVGFAAFFGDRTVAAVGGAAMLPIAVTAVRRRIRWPGR